MKIRQIFAETRNPVFNHGLNIPWESFYYGFKDSYKHFKNNDYAKVIGMAETMSETDFLLFFLSKIWRKEYLRIEKDPGFELARTLPIDHFLAVLEARWKDFPN